jgi:hypothetical protein
VLQLLQDKQHRARLRVLSFTHKALVLTRRSHMLACMFGKTTATARVSTPLCLKGMKYGTSCQPRVQPW